MAEHMHQHHRTALLAAALSLGAAQSAAAATLTWPNLFGPGTACQGTLQACIDGAAAGDTVQIGADDMLFPDRYTAVDESVTITKSLTLRAAPGIDAVFLAGRRIDVNPVSLPMVAYTVAVENVILDRGTIRIMDNSLLASTYRVEGVRFNDVLANEVGISFIAPVGAQPNVQVLRNVVRVQPSASTGTQAINLFSGGPNWQATVFGNRIEYPLGSLNRGISVSSRAAGPINISGNSLLGRDLLFGIVVEQQTGSGRALLQLVNNSVSGQSAGVSTEPARIQLLGDLNAGIHLSLQDADAQVVNNSVVDGSTGLSIFSFDSTAPISGLVANNVVAFQRSFGLVISTTVPAITNRNNLVFGNASDFFTPGPGTLTTDPQLISRGYPRPRDSSPAINAGSNSALPPFNGFDADGQPRILLATVDIGAYEAGHAITGVHEATAANVVFHYTNLSAIGDTSLVPSSILTVTPLRTPGAGAALAANLGVWLPSGSSSLPLSIFHQNAAPMLPGRRFAVTVPGFGLGGFTHLTSGANIAAQYTTLSNAALDGRPDAIAVTTHNFGAASPNHDLAIGLEYIGTRWNLRNEDFAVDMASGRNFNVVVAPALSENAFRVAAPSSGPVAEIPLAHPLLDGNPCAAPMVGRVDPPGASVVFNNTPFSVDYRAGFAGAPGRWFVVAESSGAPTAATFPAGAAFNVIIDGAQANRCRAPVDDALFADGFE